MSTGVKAPRNAPARSSRTKFNIDKAAEIKPPVVEKIDVSSLQIDESYGVECDPYNSTGQFLADALKERCDQ